MTTDSKNRREAGLCRFCRQRGRVYGQEASRTGSGASVMRQCAAIHQIDNPYI
jgi:hypothetical protein